MKRMKKLALVIAAGMICSVSAAAENFSDSIRVNGTALENTGIVHHENTEMIPLRAVCEALDFEVIWDGEAERIELVKLPVYITCTPYEDGYTFAKTAPMKLGVAPIMIEDKTYVPINFIDEILMGEYSKGEDGVVDISWGEEKGNEEVSVYIKEKTENGFLVEEFNRGEIELIVTDDTVIKNADGEIITAEEIDPTRQLTVKLSDHMTLSLPPIANALEIMETNEISKLVIEGEITEVIKKDGIVEQVVLNDNQAALNIGDDIIVNDLRTDADENAELSEGMYVRVQTKGIATMSIPPQYPVTQINIVK